MVPSDLPLLKEAITKYGIRSQLDLAQEECAELIVAISHCKRDRPNSTNEVIEEIADVRIMVTQLSIIFGEENVDKIVIEKLTRLKQILKQKEK